MFPLRYNHHPTRLYKRVDNSTFYTTFLIGGDEGTRTPDLCRAKAALFQLSYIPSITTLAVSSDASNINHGREWAFLDSNQGPQSYQDCALTT